MKFNKVIIAVLSTLMGSATGSSCPEPTYRAASVFQTLLVNMDPKVGCQTKSSMETSTPTVPTTSSMPTSTASTETSTSTVWTSASTLETSKSTLEASTSTFGTSTSTLATSKTSTTTSTATSTSTGRTTTTNSTSTSTTTRAFAKTVISTTTANDTSITSASTTTTVTTTASQNTTTTITTTATTTKTTTTTSTTTTISTTSTTIVTSTTTTTTTTIATTTTSPTRSTTKSATTTTTTLKSSTTMQESSTASLESSTPALESSTTTNDCVRLCADPGPLVSGCNSIMAGEESTCSHGESPLASCMATSFTMKCPAGNVNSSFPPELTGSASVLCKVCSVGISIDKDPRPDSYIFTISFGPLMKTSGIDESSIDGYKAFVINVEGRILREEGQVKKWGASFDSSCCAQDAYVMSIFGPALPAGSDRIMIVPYSGEDYLAVGVTTSNIIDISEGRATVFKGDIKVGFATAEAATAFTTNPSTKAALSKSIAQNLQGVDASQINILDISVQPLRRLGSGRRLNNVNVRVLYEIVIPQTDSTPEVTESDIATINPEVFKTSLNAALREAGVDNVQVASVSQLESPRKEVVGTPVEGTYNGSPSLVLSNLVAMLMFGINLLLFA